MGEWIDKTFSENRIYRDYDGYTEVTVCVELSISPDFGLMVGHLSAAVIDSPPFVPEERDIGMEPTDVEREMMPEYYR